MLDNIPKDGINKQIKYLGYWIVLNSIPMEENKTGKRQKVLCCRVL